FPSLLPTSNFQVERAEAHAAELEVAGGEQAREAARLRLEDELHRVVEDQRDGDGGEERRDRRRAGQRPEREALDQQPDHRGEEDDGDQRRDERPAEHGDEEPAEHRAEREDRPVREVDQVGDAEDQRDADRDQRVRVAGDDARDDRVEQTLPLEGCGAFPRKHAAGGMPAPGRVRCVPVETHHWSFYWNGTNLPSFTWTSTSCGLATRLSGPNAKGP